MERAKILQVSVAQGNELRRILAALGETDSFDVRQVGFSEFGTHEWRSLTGYTVVVFGISDGYCGHSGRLSEAASSALTKYVKDGGSVLWTHDTLQTQPDLFGISGFRPAQAAPEVSMWVDSVRILNHHHQVMESPYPIGDASSILKKGAHSTGSYSHPPMNLEAAAADILIDHNIEPAGPHNYFLTVASCGRGRIALLDVGHAEIENMATWEKRLLANVLHWLGPSSAQVRETRIGSAPQGAGLGSFERFALSASLTIATAALLLHFVDRRSIGNLAAGLITSVVGGFIIWWVMRPHDS